MPFLAPGKDKLMTPMLIISSIFILIVIFVYFFFLIRFIKNRKKGTTTHTDKISKSILDTIPIVRYMPDYQCYLLKDHTYMDILQIRTKDLNSIDSSERSYDMARITKLLRTLGSDCKIIALNYPCNTREQQKYLEKKIQDTHNKQYQYWLEKSRKELEWLEKNKTFREYYLMYFSDTLEMQQKNLSTILESLGTGVDGLSMVIDAKKKHNILFKLSNQNSVI